ncbi:restriction endonuclease subunit S [Vibrio parahaemolyticus]|uniref:restriction endonuclease subunit S n=1 Tax=Vibrio parahaemolyticus TaxID=670 RepID=UPI00111CA463|nr:restriction endonuclease subunit S [Vibrio parahaemolyticus]EII3284811.1 restriction endonuclease subunit S [Vibrio alginolyticus]TOB34939.1 hypothetical protein CGK08_19255 [Vibrio parahaemolyticus]
MSWEKKPLEQLGVITSSKRIYKKEYVKSGIPFFRTKEVKELANGKEIATELFISRERYLEILDKFGVPEEGDILLTAIGTIGEVYVVNNASPFYFKDGNVLWLKNFNELSPGYLRYALLSFVDELNALSNGAAYNALPIKKLKQHQVFVPPKNIQNEIVTVLDKAFADIEQARANTEKNLQNARELFDSYLQQVFSERGDRDVKGELGDFCYIKHGFAFKSDFFVEKSDYVLLTPGNFYERGGYRDRGEKQKYYGGDIPQEYILDKGALLVAMTEQAVGLLGSAALINSNNRFLHNQRLGLVKLVDEYEGKIDLEYLFYLFNTSYFRNQVQKTATGLKVRHTSPKKLMKIEVAIPKSIDTQKKIVRELNFLHSQTVRLEDIYTKKLAALDELKQSLLKQAFTGQLTQG